jgi:xanthine dehydrogenase molybdopterin-binding subunit B
VIELVVDDAALVGRIVKRAEEARAAGEPVRKDDTPEVFEVRLREYYKNTAPLIGYYWAKGDLVQIDGMAEMEAVADAIAKVLDKPENRPCAALTAPAKPLMARRPAVESPCGPSLLEVRPSGASPLVEL